MPLIALACVLVGCNGSSGATPAPTASASSFVSAPCPKTPQPIPELSTARCGLLVVPEDRRHPSGRTITLSVAIVKAASAKPKSDPIVWLAGGPGDDALTEIPMAMAGKLNKNRDVIFMSQRGTYTAQPKLTCDVVDRLAEETLNMPFDAAATGKAYAVATRKCRGELSAETSDLGAYNTLESSDDMEALRIALHVAKWNVYGISYGTDLALNYMRMHPGGIRAVGIDGIFPPSLAGGVASWPSAAEGLDAIFKACGEQTACHQRYGDIARTFQQLVNQYEASPKTFSVTVPGHTGKVDVMVSGGMLLQWAVSPGSHIAGEVPAAIDALANGDATFIASTWAQLKLNPAAIGVLSYGLFNGVSCGEWVPYETEADVVNSGRDAFPMFSLSIWHNAPNLQFMRENCAVWKVPAVASTVRDVTHSKIPTLVVSAQYDAQTAASFGAYVARTLPNSTVMTIPNIAHVAYGSPSAEANACAFSIAQSFFDNLTRADTSCIKKIPPTKFKISSAP
ncbi:MAG TPA: alpha/beta hydrolase [Candidatus Baltobacteraceae bacterium]|jgi:pimeloyl-ACP methyl ester carboxylesterase